MRNSRNNILENSGKQVKSNILNDRNWYLESYQSKDSSRILVSFHPEEK